MRVTPRLSRVQATDRYGGGFGTCGRVWLEGGGGEGGREEGWRRGRKRGWVTEREGERRSEGEGRRRRGEGEGGREDG